MHALYNGLGKEANALTETFAVNTRDPEQLSDLIRKIESLDSMVIYGARFTDSSQQETLKSCLIIGSSDESVVANPKAGPETMPYAARYTLAQQILHAALQIVNYALASSPMWQKGMEYLQQIAREQAKTIRNN